MFVFVDNRGFFCAYCGFYTVKYLPQKSEIEKHCIFYLNKMFIMTFTMTLTVMVSLLLVRLVFTA